MNLNSTDSSNVIIRSIKGHNKNITAIAIAHLGNRLNIFSASHDGAIIAWNADNGDMDAIKPIQQQHKSQINSLSYFNGSLVTCSFDDSIKYIDADTLSYKYVLECA